MQKTLLPFLVLAVSCARPLAAEAQQQTPTAPVAEAVPVVAQAGPAAPTPSASYAPGFASLQVAGYGDATVSAPLPAEAPSEARPVVVALHGLRGRADWTCHVARELFENHAFVLCPAGTPLPAKTADDRARPRYTFPEAMGVAHEIDAGLAALQATYRAAVDVHRPVLYGHSLGAILGASLALTSPHDWSRVLLSEGGYSTLAGGAATFSKHGGERVVFACGTQSCFDGARRAATALNRPGGAAAEVVYAKGAGHRSWGPIVNAMQAKVAWLLEGDARFGASQISERSERDSRTREALPPVARAGPLLARVFENHARYAR